MGLLILYYFCVGIVLVSGFSGRFFKLPQIKEFNLKEKNPTENEIFKLNNDDKMYNRDMVDFVRTLDLLMEQTADELRANLIKEKNVNNDLVDYDYLRPHYRNLDTLINEDDNFKNYRQRRQLDSIKGDLLNSIEGKEKIDKLNSPTDGSERNKMTNTTLDTSKIKEGQLENNLTESNINNTNSLNPLAILNTSNITTKIDSTDEKPTNGTKFNSTIVNTNATKNFSFAEAGHTKEVNITTGNNSVTLNSTKDFIDPSQMVQFSEHKLNESLSNETIVKANKSETNNKSVTDQVFLNKVRMSSADFDLFDDMFQNKDMNVNSKNHLQEAVLEDEAELKKLKQAPSLPGPAVAFKPANDDDLQSSKKSIYLYTMATVGIVIVVGFFGMVGFAFLQMRREPTPYVPPIPVYE